MKYKKVNIEVNIPEGYAYDEKYFQKQFPNLKLEELRFNNNQILLYSEEFETEIPNPIKEDN